MLSIRNDGAGFSELVGLHLGKETKKVMLAFSMILLFAWKNNYDKKRQKLIS